MIPDNREPTQFNQQSNDATANAYKVEDDTNLEEKDLKRTIFGGEDANPDKPGYESHGMGGESFGEINENRSGDDLANPSRNAGYSNDYFKRTEPLQEHPENQNFTPEEQEGEPDMNQGKEEVPGYREDPEQQKVGGVESDDHNKTQEGTSDNDGDQQKVNQDDSDTPGTAYYKPEDDKGTPDYGSNSPDNK